MPSDEKQPYYGLHNVVRMAVDGRRHFVRTQFGPSLDALDLAQMGVPTLFHDDTGSAVLVKRWTRTPGSKHALQAAGFDCTAAWYSDDDYLNTSNSGTAS